MSGLDLDAITQAKAQERAALLQALAGRPEPPPPFVMTTKTTDAPSRGGFDGGARRSLPPTPPTHGELLLSILRERRARMGAQLRRVRGRGGPPRRLLRRRDAYGAGPNQRVISASAS